MSRVNLFMAAIAVLVAFGSVVAEQKCFQDGAEITITSGDDIRSVSDIVIVTCMDGMKLVAELDLSWHDRQEIKVTGSGATKVVEAKFSESGKIMHLSFANMKITQCHVQIGAPRPFSCSSQADTCRDSYISSGLQNATQSCTEAGGGNLGCTVSCKSGFAFQSGATSMSYSCSGANEWSPSLPVEACVVHNPDEKNQTGVIVGGTLGGIVLVIVIIVAVVFWRKRASGPRSGSAPSGTVPRSGPKEDDSRPKSSVDIEGDAAGDSNGIIELRSPDMRIQSEMDGVSSAEGTSAALMPDRDLHSAQEPQNSAKSQLDMIEAKERMPLLKRSFQEERSVENSDTSVMELRLAYEDPQETGRNMVPLPRNLGEPSGARRQQGRLSSQRYTSS